MACMTHLCCECGIEWFDNLARGTCPECGGSASHSFDEEPDDREEEEEEEECED